MSLLATVLAQSLLTFHVDGEGPVRFGVPLPAESIVRGLRLSGRPKPVLQWRPLQHEPGVGSDRIWVEIVADGVTGRAKLLAGGQPPEDAGPGASVVEQVVLGEGTRLRVERSYRGGQSDWLSADPLPGSEPGVRERYGVGRAGGRLVEWSADWVTRRTRVRIPTKFWRRVELLPRPNRSGAKLRRRLLELEEHFLAIRAPGAAGVGDTVRYGREVTNGEFDLTLGLLHLALSTGESKWLRRAYLAARHLVDVDLDRGSGLPFRHGSTHRRMAPEIGHVWIRGLRRVALVFADEQLLQDARTMTRSLAERIRSAPGQGKVDRLRDEGWPLWELESSLRFEYLPPVVSACDRLHKRILSRWRPALCAFQYAESRSVGEVSVERVWLTAGILLPALELSTRRTGESIDAMRHAIEQRLVRQALSHSVGIPSTFRIRGTEVVGVGARAAAPEGFLLLDGLSPKCRRKLLDRFESDLLQSLDPRQEDFATRFALAARASFLFG